MTKSRFPVHGAGLGLRRAMLGPLSTVTSKEVDFMEVAPENWINLGGRFGRQFRQYTERFPFICHGLSLSIGSPEPLDWELLSHIKQFIKEHHIQCYSEHLSYCSDDGHLYDLLPIPFTEDAVEYVAGRISQVQDFLGQQIALENVSYYAAPQQEMSELEFITSVLDKADCKLLLDVNNIYVNGINHRYDPEKFMLSLPPERIAYCHIAGHFEEAEDLRVDTHGSDVIDPVWGLLEKCYQAFGQIPTLLERDFNIPSREDLLSEVDMIRKIQRCYIELTMDNEMKVDNEMETASDLTEGNESKPGKKLPIRVSV